MTRSGPEALLRPPGRGRTGLVAVLATITTISVAAATAAAAAGRDGLAARLLEPLLDPEECEAVLERVVTGALPELCDALPEDEPDEWGTVARPRAHRSTRAHDAA